MPRLFLLAGLFLVLTFASCGWSETDTVEKEGILSADDRSICTTANIDSILIKKLRGITPAKLELFTPEALWVYSEEGEMIERASGLHGVYFEAIQDSARSYVMQLSPYFKKNSYTIYVCEENFGIGNLKDKVAIVPTADTYTILKETGTDGINYDIDNDSLIRIIKTFDAKYELTLIGCNTSWCEFTFAKEPTDWLILATECYKVCPDIVEQGTGDVESLASEIRRTKTLYFWWD